MGIYKGNPEENFYKRISFDGKILESTEQLNWGYYSGGPMNTADLILTHHLSNDPSIELRNAFSKDIISNFEKDKEFTLTSEEIDEWLETQGIKTNSTAKSENIIKKTCKELGLTYAQLAEQIGYSEPAIKKAIANETVSEPMQKSILLYLRTLELEKQLEDYAILKSALKKAIN